MSTVLEQRSLPAGERRRIAAWLAVAAGFAALYLPTFVGLARTLWREEDYAHGPIVLAVAAYLLWRQRRVIASGRPQLSGALALLAVGLVLYVVGRSQSLPLFETASLVPVVAGTVLAMAGWGALRAAGFALLFLAFLVPVPGFILEAATGPLKEFVSAVVAVLLGALGYPIERAGVVLDVGGHQMLVADACSGMNSIVTLTALTLLYTHLTGPSRARRWIVLLAMVVPIAVAANVLRVLLLVLVAYHFGDDAAQGAVHTAAGLLVFIAAFLMLVGADSLFGLRRRRNEGNPPPRDYALTPHVPRLMPAFVVAATLAAAAVAAPLLKPVHAEGPAIALDSVVPQAFGDWSMDRSIEPIAPTAEVRSKLERIYDQTVSRTYVNSAGEQVMLTVAYGGDQSDALKAHRQEVCYRAQGFDVGSIEHAQLALPQRSVPVTRFFAVRGERLEPVTYWFTMGDRVVRGRLERLAMQLRQGFAGHVPDGVLVRVSSISGDPAHAYAAQQAFAAALVAAMPANDRVRLAGAAAD